MLTIYKNRRDNLKNIFQITQYPSDTHIRTVLDEVATKELKKFFRPYIQEIDNQGVLDDYECLDGYVLIPIDGTGYFSSKEIHCDQCLEKHIKMARLLTIIVH